MESRIKWKVHNRWWNGETGKTGKPVSSEAEPHLVSKEKNPNILEKKFGKKSSGKRLKLAEGSKKNNS